MNRILSTTFVIAATLVVGVLFSGAVKAEDSAPMTEEHIARIRNNCVDTQSILTQLHATDAGLRVDRGQLYESIATKLMGPFNSRLVLNRINEETLLSTASEYEKQLQTFRLHYQQYEEAMSATLRINCVNQPVAFYDSVVDTREKRRLTHDSVVELHRTIQKYSAAVDVFAKSIQVDKS
jgi:hypothetical protein